MTDQLPIYQLDLKKRRSDYIYATSIDGLYYIVKPINKDNRGFFSQIAVIPELESVIGRPFVIRQVNHARSQTNVVRGIHAENWNKYISVTAGICYSIIVDLRPNSSTFLKKEYFRLDGNNQKDNGAIFISAGLGNSVWVVSGPVDYMYFVDKLYSERDPKDDIAIDLFDPDINLQLPLPKEKLILSKRDKNGISVRSLYPEKFS